ncbi:MAG TPA: hypothetical protein DCM45_01785, partial [Clostridiales bacterium]|nr:hypothetical protein [Clostridiales bacterium]
IQLYHKWDSICRKYFLKDQSDRQPESRMSFNQLIDRIIEDFDQLPLTGESRKPRVGLVGEILVKFQPDANNHAIDMIESEGCEAVVPGLLDFFMYCFFNKGWKAKNLGTSRLGAVISDAAVRFMESSRRHMSRALAGTNGKFRPPVPISHLGDKAQNVLSLGNDSGEGWFLTAEMLELIEDGVPNIICAQPFACLPNHVTGKGMIKELRRQYPEANIVAIDYDPGASEVNQLNRIKLMISTAFRQRLNQPDCSETAVNSSQKTEYALN